MANVLPVHEQAIDLLLESQAAAYSITWLFEKYDAGEHAQALEAIRLLAPLIENKIGEAMALVESLGPQSVSGVLHA
ncbi:hypothetical protein [Burkholderia cenocepacia]|uniref:hypothetical protein n=1 Tax=Burkholderia cenocepacia TaxID=95486 RepID=UPI00222EC879|nr:hypothetical protein [Burkholderia cenocepacia]MCW3539306.1 hypothetical protein [Burkholderia cenocepacia]